MANPSGNHHEPTTSAHPPSPPFNGVPGANPTTNENMAPPSENSGARVAIKHNPGISLNWTPEEQALLEEGLAKYASDSSLIRYAKIALQLQSKTVRDVAFRARWMSKKENSKRRKEDHNLTRKSKDRKERVIDSAARSSHFAARPNVPLYAPPMITVDNDDGISMEAIGGPACELLQRNANALNQISVNLANCQIQENISLFCQTRDNIFKIMNELVDLPDVMKQMPPLPVKLNEELANSILPRSTLPMQS